VAYYGRGLVQLTWRNNYKKMGDLLGLDLVHHPKRLWISALPPKFFLLE
jgi:predicted chitinase